MIDFHSHILPEMDDGSRSLEMTRRMLRVEREQGVTDLVASPHFYAQHESPQQFLKRRENRLIRVKEMLKSEPWAQDMHIYAGAEVLYYPGMAGSSELDELCIEGTKTLLLEMPFMQWDGEHALEVRRIMEVRGIRIMLAHIERYVKYQKNKKIWNEILELPVLLQINADDMLTFGKRRICTKILRQRSRIVLGSDCHNLTKRPPQMKEGRTRIKKIAGGEEILERIDQFGEQVLGL